MDPHVPPSHACLTSLTPCSRSNSLIRLEQSAGHTAYKLCFRCTTYPSQNSFPSSLIFNREVRRYLDLNVYLLTKELHLA